MTTTLTRSQDEILERLRLRLADPSDAELRHIPLAHALDRAHAADVIADDNPQRDALLAGYPETAPTRAAILADIVQNALPALLSQIRNVRSSGVDFLAEQAWLLGRAELSEQIVAPGAHADVLPLLVAVVQFCRGFGIPLPGEGTDDGVAPDLAEAVAVVDGDGG